MANALKDIQVEMVSLVDRAAVRDPIHKHKPRRFLLAKREGAELPAPLDSGPSLAELRARATRKADMAINPYIFDERSAEHERLFKADEAGSETPWYAIRGSVDEDDHKPRFPGDGEDEDEDNDERLGVPAVHDLAGERARGTYAGEAESSTEKMEKAYVGIRYDAQELQKAEANPVELRMMRARRGAAELKLATELGIRRNPAIAAAERYHAERFAASPRVGVKASAAEIAER